MIQSNNRHHSSRQKNRRQDFLYIFEQYTIDPDKLLQSLKQVLYHYPAFAGRMVQGSGGAKIDLSDAGAAFTVAHQPGNVMDLPQEPPIGAPYCHIPSPSGQVEGKEPLLTVTLTKFTGGGCTLGVVVSHLISDGWTFAMVGPLPCFSRIGPMRTITFPYKNLSSIAYQVQ